MQTGTITSRVTTSDALIPIEGAYMWISQGDKLISFQVTDENGKTSAVEIETPDRADSLSPENGVGAVFAVCDIRVYHPEYQPIEILNAQIFAGVNTLQEFSLIPQLEFSPAGDNLDITNVTRQNL